MDDKVDMCGFKLHIHRLVRAALEALDVDIKAFTVDELMVKNDGLFIIVYIGEGKTVEAEFNMATTLHITGAVIKTVEEEVLL